MGLADGRVVSAAALLCPAVGNDDVLVVGVEAGLLIAPLYRLRNDEATAEVAVVSIAWNFKKEKSVQSICKKGRRRQIEQQKTST